MGDGQPAAGDYPACKAGDEGLWGGKVGESIVHHAAIAPAVYGEGFDICADDLYTYIPIFGGSAVALDSLTAAPVVSCISFE